MTAEGNAATIEGEKQEEAATLQMIKGVLGVSGGFTPTFSFTRTLSFM